VSSPITFSGFNQIDFNQILTAVMQQERAPLTRLETQKKTLETQNTAYSALAGKLTSLKSAVENLKETDSLSLLSATSSNSGVGVSATGGTVSGTYDVVVTELARAQVTASQSTYATLTTAVASGGTLTLTLTPNGGGAATVISAPDGTTLSQLATLINAEADAPAAASVVQTSPGVYQLVLTGKESGLTNGFTLTTAMSAGTGLTFTDTDTDGISGDSTLDNSQDARNAALTVNGLAVTSASNTVTGVIPGVTLSLLKKEDPPATATVRVTRDTTAAKDLVKKFITAYNDLTTFAKDQNTAAIAGKASIGRDPLLRGLRDALRNTTSDEFLGGTLTRLAEIGVGFDMSGKMTLDDAIFADRLDDSPADVQLLLSGSDGTGGVFGAMSDIVEEYAQTGGLISSTRERNDETIRGLNRRMDSMSAQLELRRAALQREYIAADLAMTRLKSQSSSLSSMSGQYRLF
jgi:flagellar hook-associated protein 2